MADFPDFGNAAQISYLRPREKDLHESRKGIAGTLTKPSEYKNTQDLLRSSGYWKNKILRISHSFISQIVEGSEVLLLTVCYLFNIKILQSPVNLYLLRNLNTLL